MSTGLIRLFIFSAGSIAGAPTASTAEPLADPPPGRLAPAPSPDEVASELRRIHARYPEQTELIALGKTHLGRTIWALRAGETLNLPAILLSSAQHANEAATPLHVIDAIHQLLEDKDGHYQGWLAQVALVAVPMVNPDGGHLFQTYRRGAGRKNGRQVFPDQSDRGVDLNRNYAFRWSAPTTRFASADPNSRFYRGPSAASEPEVQAMMALADRERFVASISYHSAATRLLVPYSAPPSDIEQPALPWAIAHQMIDALPHRFGRRRYQARRSLYPVTGVEKDWLFHRYGTQAFVLELPYRLPEGKQLRESIVHSRGAWVTLFKRWIDGPALSLRAVDDAGRPVEAFVSVVGARASTLAPQRTHPQSGWLHRYLPTTDEVTVLATWQGAAQTRTLKVEGVHHLEFVFPLETTLSSIP